MRKYLLIVLLTTTSLFTSMAQVAVNIDGNTADGTAMLDIQSTAKGLLVPRMTEADRDGIDSPATGLIIYQNDATSGFYFYSGSSWVKFNSGAMSLNDLTNAITTGASVAIGGIAGTSNTTGTINTFVGYGSGNYNKTGKENTAVGAYSFQYNLDGDQNSALGSGALSQNQGTRNSGVGYYTLNRNRLGGYNSSLGAYSLFFTNGGSYNAAVGNQSLYTNITGNNNTASGFKALFSNTTDNNTAVGYQAAYNNTSGEGNTAMGYEASFSTIEGPYNSSFGYQALYSNVNGYYSTAVGYQALYNSTGNSNTATGFKAMYNNAAGQQNTAVGHNVMNGNTTGSGNVAMGFETFFSNTSGSNNTAIGFQSYYSGSYSNSTAIGYSAAINASNQVRIGNSSVDDIGGYANWTTLTTKSSKTNVKENVAGLDFILKLRPVTYKVNINNQGKSNNSQTYSGFIAQEVEQSATSIGYEFGGVDIPEDKNDNYGIRYSKFVVPIVKAMQEQQQTIDEQRRMIDNLIIEVEKLKK